MPEVIPKPSEYATPVNEPVTAAIPAGQRATFIFEPTNRTTPGFVVPTVAASKLPDSAYTVRFDEQTKFGPAPAPPTDVNDVGVTFLPAFEFEETLEVIVENLADTGTRTYTVQPVGYERSDETGGGSGGA